MAKMQKTHDVVATVGEYQDRNGETKKRYVNVGALFTDPETGHMSAKMEAFPCSPEWSGWLSFFEVDREPSERGQRRSRPKTARDMDREGIQRQNAKRNNEEDEDEIPF